MNPQTVKSIMDLLELVDRYKQNRDRQEGRLEQLSSRLQAEFSCNTLEDAQKLLNKWHKKQAELARELENKKVEFDAAYKDKLDSL